MTVPIELQFLMPKFIERREKDIVELTCLLNAHEFVSIKNMGHRLKGIGASFGVPLISDIGSELEDAADVRDAEKVAQLIGEMVAVTQGLRGG